MYIYIFGYSRGTLQQYYCCTSIAEEVLGGGAGRRRCSCAPKRGTAIKKGRPLIDWQDDGAPQRWPAGWGVIGGGDVSGGLWRVIGVQAHQVSCFTCVLLFARS